MEEPGCNSCQLVAEAGRGRPTATGTPFARRRRRSGSLAYLFVVPVAPFQQRPRSRTYHRPIRSADLGPCYVEPVLRKWVPRCQSLVEVDAEPGLLIGPHRTVVDVGASREHLSGALTKQAGLLDAEVGACEVELEVGCVAHRGHVAWPMPGGSGTEELTQRRG